MTSRVPRGEIHLTVCSGAARLRAARTPESADIHTPATAARLRKSLRVISLVTASPILSSIPCFSFPGGSWCRAAPAVSGRPAGPALADEVEDDVDEDPENGDDQDRRTELGHP